MSELIKLVRTYRLTVGLADRLRLAEEVFAQIEPDLRYFIFGNVSNPPNAEDVLQETLKGIATGLQKFAGNSHEEFWAWCYKIARHKISDHWRRQMNDRMQPTPPDELLEIVERSARDSSLSPEVKLDLEYAIGLLIKSKPDCYDVLWKRHVIGLDYAEIAEEQNINYDAARMKLERCLEHAQSLMP